MVQNFFREFVIIGLLVLACYEAIGEESKDHDKFSASSRPTVSENEPRKVDPNALVGMFDLVKSPPGNRTGERERPAPQFQSFNDSPKRRP